MTLPRRFASPAMSLLLVFTMIAAGPMAGTASADTTISTDCGVDDAIRGLYSTIDPEVDCGLYSDQTQELNEHDAVTKAAALEASQTSYNNTRSNLLQDVEGVMFMKGKAAAIRALENGSNESEATAAFEAAVRDYTTRLTINDMRDAERRAFEIRYLAEEAGSTNSSTVFVTEARANTTTATYELWNGTRFSMEIPNDDNRVVDPLRNAHINDGPINLVGYENGWLTGDGDILFTERDSEDGAQYSGAEQSDTYMAYNGYAYGVLQLEYHEAMTRVNSNGADFVSNAYPAVESGEIDPADLWDPLTLAQEASTDYNSTGYYSFSSASLSAIGLAGDQNVSHVVETQYTTSEYNGSENATLETATYNATIEGTLFLSGADSLTLDTGTTYYPSNLSGTPYMTVASATDSTGESINDTGAQIQLQNSFTILNATNTQTGDPVQTTSAEDKNYTTTNITEFKQTIDRLQNERQMLEEERSSWGGGDSTPTPENKQSSLDPAALLLITAGAAVIALLLKGGSNRR